MRDIKLISREDARSRGLSKYFTGEPCNHGHACERSTLNTNCVKCHAIYTHNHYVKTKEAKKQQLINLSYRKSKADSYVRNLDTLMCSQKK